MSKKKPSTKSHRKPIQESPVTKPPAMEERKPTHQELSDAVDIVKRSMERDAVEFRGMFVSRFNQREEMVGSIVEFLRIVHDDDIGALFNLMAGTLDNLFVEADGNKNHYKNNSANAKNYNRGDSIQLINDVLAALHDVELADVAGLFAYMRAMLVDANRMPEATK